MGPVEIVDSPIKNSEFPVRKLLVYQRVPRLLAISNPNHLPGLIAKVPTHHATITERERSRSRLSASLAVAKTFNVPMEMKDNLVDLGLLGRAYKKFCHSLLVKLTMVNYG